VLVRFREDTYNHYKEHAQQIGEWKRNLETTEALTRLIGPPCRVNAPRRGAKENTMAVKPEEIASIIREQIEQFGTTITAVDVGSVVEAGDGIARVYGLGNAMYSELLEFQTVDDAGGRGTVIGMALNLEEDTVGAIILGDYLDIKEGTEVRSTGRIVQ